MRGILIRSPVLKWTIKMIIFSTLALLISISKYGIGEFNKVFTI
jgi:hypothetical protein